MIHQHDPDNSVTMVAIYTTLTPPYPLTEKSGIIIFVYGIKKLHTYHMMGIWNVIQHIQAARLRVELYTTDEECWIEH